MTHSGGKPHEVGDRGQRYEISVFDENINGRRIIGWTDDKAHADQVCESIVTRPGWRNARCEDRVKQQRARDRDAQCDI